MVESILSVPNIAVAAPKAAPTITPRREFLNPDGSAIPDVIAYHHRPEDLDDMSDQDVSNDGNSAFLGADGLTFGDVLDIVNPLQHIPVVSTFYRAMTGDEISPGARIAGGALFGGPIGFGVAVVNAVIEAATGEDIGETLIATLTGDAPAKTVQTAAAKQTGGTAVATAVTDSDPAILGVAAKPARLLPAADTAAQRPTAQTASQPQAAAVMSFIGNGLPFGGMGTMPFAGGPEKANDPVAAVLMARSAVPMSGPIAGLGRAPLGQVVREQPIPVLSSRLSDKLAAFAAKTAAPPTQSKPARAADNENKPTEATAGQTVPSSMISKIMLDALDRYREMKKVEAGNLPG